MPFEPFFPPPSEWAPESAGLTHPQLTAIGAVVTTWSIVETAMQRVLFVLAQSADKLGQALTEDLGPDHRLKALRRLCHDWESFLTRYERTELLDAVGEVRACAAWIQKNKDRRNQIVHWQWMRASDEKMLAFKYTLKPSQNPKHGQSFFETTPVDVMAFATEISEMASRLLRVVRLLDQELPIWPKMHA